MARTLAAGPLLCGVDFSDDSRNALAWAAALAGRLWRELRVVAVIEPLLAEAAKASAGEAGFLDQAQRDLTEFVKSALATSAAAVAIEVVVGHPGEAIRTAAVAHDASIIVVGTHGLGRAKRLVFGSTTLGLLRASDRPVLAVPVSDGTAPRSSGATPFLSHVVCGIDFSDASLTAARWAVDLGARVSAAVVLVHAVTPLTVPSTWDALVIASVDDRLETTTSRLSEIAQSLGPHPPTTKTRVGAVTDVVGEEACAHDSSLIVLGLGGASSHRPGTHAYRLLTETRVPVVAVPGGS